MASSVIPKSAKRGKECDREAEQQPTKSRRLLACETCRRIKSRCDFDMTFGSCNRCKNLRLECSLRKNMPDTRPVVRQDEQITPVIKELNERMAEQATILTELKEMLSRSSASDCPSNSRAESSWTMNVPCPRVPSPPNLKIQDNRKITLPADQDTQSAPVSIIRSVNDRMSAGLNRLFNGSLRDGVNQAILSPAVAQDLLKAFFDRAGRWLQFESWDVMDVKGDPRRNAPLLYATCCLQGGRLTESFCNTVAHETLYERVRSMLGQVLMVSPLPVESVYALALMAIWGIAPKGKVEYIDSWLFSGYCVQHAMLSINFTTIMANISMGRSTVYERTALRLWNQVCLCHLHFSVGTGRPSVIAPAYLDQCPSILNIYEATTHDRMIVAEILLYSNLQKLLTRSFPLELDGSCVELEAWNKKWDHLFEIKDDRARAFHMLYHFAHLVLAQRSLKQLPDTPESPAAPAPSSALPRDQYIHHSITSATSLLLILRSLPSPTIRELPENIHLSVAYSMMVLAEHLEVCPNTRETIALLQGILAYYSQATPKTVAIVEYAFARVQGAGGGRVGGGDGISRRASDQSAEGSRSSIDGEGCAKAVAVDTDLGIPGAGLGATAAGTVLGFETGPGIAAGTGDMTVVQDWGFPSLEDLFSGTFGNTIPWEAQGFELCEAE